MNPLLNHHGLPLHLLHPCNIPTLVDLDPRVHNVALPIMLKPFQIRDLHVSLSSGHEVNSDPPVSQGVVQISATDYDDIASNYPRARLTYMDYDDGDQITVSIYPKYSLCLPSGG